MSLSKLTLFSALILSVALSVVPARAASKDYRFTTLSTSFDLTNPYKIALLPNGNALVAVSGSGTLLEVTPEGATSLFAGSESNRPEIVISPGLVYIDQIVDDTREHFFASQVAVDDNGNVYAPHGYSIRRMNSSGLVETIAGKFDEQGSTDGDGASARFHSITALATDSIGNVYIGNGFNFTIRKISPTGQVSTFVGKNGERGIADGLGATARLDLVNSIVVDDQDNLWISSGATIRKITPAGQVSTVAGNAENPRSSGYWDAQGLSAKFASRPVLSLAADGNLWIADEGNSAIRTMTPDTTVSSIGGYLGQRGLVDGLNQDSRFNQPQGIAVFANGNVLISDTANNQLRLGMLEFTSEAALGTYFGTTSEGADWSLWLREPGHGTFTTRLPSAGSVLVADVTIDERDLFQGMAEEILPIGSNTSAQLRHVTGSIAQIAPGVLEVSGNIDGSSISFTGSFPRTGSGTPFSGSFYTAVALGTEVGTLYTSVGFSGDYAAYLVLPNSIDSARAVLGPGGSNTVGTTNGDQLTIQIDSANRSLTASLSRADSISVLGSFSNRSTAPAGAGPKIAADGSIISFAGLSVEAANTTRLVNLSIRSRAGSGDQTLVMGFVVSGSTSKSILLRGIGPTLTDFDVAGAANDPRLLLFGAGSSTDPILENDNWEGAAELQESFSRLGAFELNANSLDAALAGTLTAGPYTAQIRADESGVSLVEAYDNDTSRETRLINLSARTESGTGSDTLTGGFVISGNSPIRLLARGVGPTLAAFGVAGSLSDPELNIFDSVGGLVASNDDWLGDPDVTTAAAKVGAFALESTESKDAALLVTLLPGAYTVQVVGSDGSSGVALVELYEIP